MEQNNPTTKCVYALPSPMPLIPLQRHTQTQIATQVSPMVHTHHTCILKLQDDFVNDMRIGWGLRLALLLTSCALSKTPL